MDALGTAIVMGLDDVVADILDFIPQIDYGKTDTEVSLFETTIRYLGGMLSGAGPSLFRTPPERARARLELMTVSLRHAAGSVQAHGPESEGR